MLCFALRNLEAEGSVWTFLPYEDAPGVKVWMQAHMFSFRNQTELPFFSTALEETDNEDRKQLLLPRRQKPGLGAAWSSQEYSWKVLND